jgi:hypothetical protein
MEVTLDGLMEQIDKDKAISNAETELQSN